MTPEETVEVVANHTDGRVIAITDHGTVEGAFVAQDYARQFAPHLDVIIGQEVCTGDGDVGGLFLKSMLPACKTAAQAIEAIHAQGGLAVAVHPFSRWITLNSMKGTGTKIFDLPFDAVEIINGFPANIFSNPITALLNRYRGQHLPEFGGSDSHVVCTVGQGHTQFTGTTAADFRRSVEEGAIKPGGGLWSLPNMARILSLLGNKSNAPQSIFRLGCIFI